MAKAEKAAAGIAYASAQSATDVSDPAFAAAERSTRQSRFSIDAWPFLVVADAIP